MGVDAIAHTHPQERGHDLRVLGQLIYSVHPFLTLIRFPSVSCIKRSQPVPSSLCPFFSKPLAHLSQPLHIASHLLFLPVSLYSLLCALGHCYTDLTPLSWDATAACLGRGQEDGVLLAQRGTKEIWPQSNGQPHALCVLTHSDNESKSSDQPSQQADKPCRVKPCYWWNCVQWWGSPRSSTD